MTLSTALFIFAAQLLAYLVKGLIGFGNPLISAPILSMGLDNVVITPGSPGKTGTASSGGRSCRCWRPTSAA